MRKSQKFGELDDSSYTLTIGDSELKLDCYLKGSIAGGSGTECIHTIDATKMAEYFAAIGVKNGEELMARLETYNGMELAQMHSAFSKFQTDVFVWVETDWS